MARKPKERDFHPVDEPVELSEPGRGPTVAGGETHSSWVDGQIWMRGLFVVVLGFLTCFAMPALGILSLIQFIWLLSSGHKNAEVAELGGKIATWLGEAGRFAAGATDIRPFPWNDAG